MFDCLKTLLVFQELTTCEDLSDLSLHLPIHFILCVILKQSTESLSITIFPKEDHFCLWFSNKNVFQNTIYFKLQKTSCTAADNVRYCRFGPQSLEKSERSRNIAKCWIGSLLNLPSSHTCNYLSHIISRSLWPTFYPLTCLHVKLACSLFRPSRTFPHYGPTTINIIQNVWQQEQHRWPTRGAF